MLKYLLIALLVCDPLSAQGAKRNDEIGSELKRVYSLWRASFNKSDYRGWKSHTASYRQMRVRNQVISEKRKFPDAVFQVPIKPPAITNLELLGVLVEGESAAATFFGKVDFGVGGRPKDNVLTLLFVREGPSWKYDTARYFNLENMPDLRRRLADRSAKHLEEEGFQPLSEVPTTAPPCPAPRYIAKIFVDCPGRIVEAKINNLSPHEFTDTRTAEIIWGGARLGNNPIHLKIRKDPSAEELGPLRVEVYLLPEIPGNVPVKAYALNCAADEDPPKVVDSGFLVNADLLAKGKRN